MGHMETRIGYPECSGASNLSTENTFVWCKARNLRSNFEEMEESKRKAKRSKASFGASIALRTGAIVRSSTFIVLQWNHHGGLLGNFRVEET